MPHHPARHRLLAAAARGLLATCLLLATAAIGADDTGLQLETNEQRPWELPANLERIAVADPEVADVITLSNRRQALLVGKSPGTTTLLLWRRGDQNPQRVRVEVRGALQGRLQQGSAATLSVDSGRGLLQGELPSALEHDRARKAAAAALGEQGTLLDATTISTGGVVQVEVKVVEFSRTVLQQIGVNFTNANGGFSYGIGRNTDSSAGNLSSAFNLVFEKLLPGGGVDWAGTLSLLQSNGMARVLAEPTLVALSGQSASFLAGGELPILEPQGLGTTTISWKPFGIGLTVTPTVLAADRIALKVAPEASDLDYTNGIMLNEVQVPAISTRRADTTVELGDGESVLIGGLVSNKVSSSIAKVPLLGHLPIIGAFFRSLNYSREDKELVIMVTPRLVRPLARDTRVPLPGEKEAATRTPVWGSWLLHPAGPDQLPGFSR